MAKAEIPCLMAENRSDSPPRRARPFFYIRMIGGRRRRDRRNPRHSRPRAYPQAFFFLLSVISQRGLVQRGNFGALIGKRGGGFGRHGVGTELNDF